MKAEEWIEMLQDRGLNVCLGYRAAFWIGANSGSYTPNSDQIAFTKKFSKEVVFHELGHWTGHPSRLNRPTIVRHCTATSTITNEEADFEEAIAWEVCKLMVKHFGGGKSHYYRNAPQWKNMHNISAKAEGKRAYEFICEEFGL